MLLLNVSRALGLFAISIQGRVFPAKITCVRGLHGKLQTEGLPQLDCHLADAPGFGCNWPHKRGSGDGLQKHKRRCQIEDQHSNHNEDHVVAVILSHFCILHMIDAYGSQQLPFQRCTALVLSVQAQAERA